MKGRPLARAWGRSPRHGPHAEGRQVIIHEADHIRRHQAPRTEPETLDVRRETPRHDFLQEHVQARGDAGVGRRLPRHGKIVERYPAHGRRFSFSDRWGAGPSAFTRTSPPTAVTVSGPPFYQRCAIRRIVTSVCLRGAEPTEAAVEPAWDATIPALAVGAPARVGWPRDEASGPVGMRPPGPADRPGRSRPACPRTRTGGATDARSGAAGNAVRAVRPAGRRGAGQGDLRL